MTGVRVITPVNHSCKLNFGSDFNSCKTYFRSDSLLSRLFWGWFFLLLIVSNQYFHDQYAITTVGNAKELARIGNSMTESRKGRHFFRYSKQGNSTQIWAGKHVNTNLTVSFKFQHETMPSHAGWVNCENQKVGKQISCGCFCWKIERNIDDK